MLGLGLGVNRYNIKPPGLLEQYKSSIVMGFSYYKLFASSRLCVRVRRSSDNAQQDFGFVGNYIDIAGILSFCGSGSGFVSIWYNQFTGGNNAFKSITGQQPRIVNNEVFENIGLYFNSSLSNSLEVVPYSAIDLVNPFIGIYSSFYHTGAVTYVFSRNENSSTVTDVHYYMLARNTGGAIFRLSSSNALPPMINDMEIKANIICSDIQELKCYTYYNNVENLNFGGNPSPIVPKSRMAIGARHNGGETWANHMQGYIKTLLIYKSDIPLQNLRRI